MAKDADKDFFDDFFQSMNHFKSIVTRIAKDKMNDGNVFHSTHAVLGVLKKGGTMTMSNIGNILSISKSNLTPIVDGLIKEGFVERNRDETDRRLVNIELTSKGKEEIEMSRRLVFDELYKKIKSLGKAESEKFFNAIRDIKEVMLKINFEDGEK